MDSIGNWDRSRFFLSCFILSMPGGVINLVVVSELLPYRYFIAGNIVGETVNVALLLTRGFAFGAT